MYIQNIYTFQFDNQLTSMWGRTGNGIHVIDANGIHVSAGRELIQEEK